jgi:hypothetical protein
MEKSRNSELRNDDRFIETLKMVKVFGDFRVNRTNRVKIMTEQKIEMVISEHEKYFSLLTDILSILPYKYIKSNYNIISIPYMNFEIYNTKESIGFSIFLRFTHPDCLNIYNVNENYIPIKKRYYFNKLSIYFKIFFYYTQKEHLWYIWFLLCNILIINSDVSFNLINIYMGLKAFDLIDFNNILLGNK